MTIECDESDSGEADDLTQYRAEADETPSMAVVDAVATASGRSQTGTGGVTDVLDPLAESVDPEALDRIFGTGATPEGATVEFPYSGYQVAVKGGETVYVSLE